MNSILLEPLDTWYFGTGTPFEAGEEHVAESLFPPLPRTAVGALRASILRSFYCDPNEYGRNGGSASNGPIAEAAQAIGKPQRVGPDGLRMRGPFIAKWFGTHPHLKTFFPVPADVVTVTGCDELHYLQPLKDGPASASTLPDGLHPVWVRRSGSIAQVADQEEQRLADACTMQRLLRSEANLPKGELARARELFHTERRAGNALLHKTTREGYLYEIGLVNPRGGREQLETDAHGQDFLVGLAFEVGGLDLDRVPGYLQLGGERRWAIVRDLPPISWPQPPQAGLTHFKLYLATPCVLKDGWRPAWLNGDVGEWCDHPLLATRVKLVSIAVAGKANVGGYCLAGHKSRGLQAAVPAGTVYFFEAEAPLSADDLNKLHLNCFGAEDEETDEHKLGMGLSFIGSWDYA